MPVLQHVYICLFTLLTLCTLLECFFLEGAAIAGLAALGYKFHCKVHECCIDEHIPYNISKLRLSMKDSLFGQPLATEIATILEGHRAAFGKKDHNALAISLHGWPGTGKNYIANMIADALFLHPKSKYVKWYLGRNFYPDKSLQEQKVILEEEISSLVKSCERALIIFDEINDMPPGILDAIKPMLDFHREYRGVNYQNAVFLFLSNINGDQIMEQFLRLNKPRNEMTFSDFELIIRKGAYDEAGGFRDSNLLMHQLIDHYIPFLPLEQSHVENCIVLEFESWGIFNIEQQYIDEAMSVISFGPKENPIFSSSGCKRIKATVAYLIKKHQFVKVHTLDEVNLSKENTWWKYIVNKFK